MKKNNINITIAVSGILIGLKPFVLLCVIWKLSEWLPTWNISLGVIQQLRGPKFTQFWPPTPLEWIIVDILHLWTFYRPPSVFLFTLLLNEPLGIFEEGFQELREEGRTLKVNSIWSEIKKMAHLAAALKKLNKATRQLRFSKSTNLKHLSCGFLSILS